MSIDTHARHLTSRLKRWMSPVACRVPPPLSGYDGKFPPRLPPSKYTLHNPITNHDSPDPWVIRHNSMYYMTCTTGGDVTIFRSASIDFRYAEALTVFTPPLHPSTGAPLHRDVWAPELHLIADRWYIYFTMANNVPDPVPTHRMYVLAGPAALGPDSDPYGPYEFCGKLSDESDTYAIDGTVLHVPGIGEGPGEGPGDGRCSGLFCIWSGWEGDVNIGQQLYIAPMSDPLTISGERVLISRPTFPWECVGMAINEGPEVLIRGGHIFLTFSASASWTPDYCIGMSRAAIGSDLMDPASWVKQKQPMFRRNDGAGVYNVGHASFTSSPDGTEDWIVYHAQDSIGGGWHGRKARVQRFVWDANGMPSFGVPLAVTGSLFRFGSQA